MKELKNLKRVAKEELEKLDAQYANKSEFTAADAEMYKCLTMALEKQMRIEQIEKEMGEGEYEFQGMSGDDGGMSGRRGRSPSTGQYVSREGGRSYNEGYSRGYSEAMRRMYPPEMPW